MRSTTNVDLPNAPEALRRSNTRLHDLTYAYLKGLLLAGGLDPGDQITSEAVGQALSVSRAPVSDAIRRLTVEGLLEVLPQVGCRVVRPVPGEVADFYEVFGATEGVIARLAAARRSPAEADEFRRLSIALASEADLPTDPDLRFLELRKRNRRRYEMLHQLARSPLSTAIGESFWDRSDFFLRVTFGGRGLPDYVRIGHETFMRAVAAGDVEAAERETRAYLVRLGHDVADALLRSGR
jgi:DNA-binding GntR family transcriptional regulator